MSEKSYVRPVCGFNGLKEAPYDKQGVPSYEVCPCCGFEFGADGANDPIVFTDFRQRWIKDGARWFVPRLKPQGWELAGQLRNIKQGE